MLSDIQATGLKIAFENHNTAGDKLKRPTNI